MITILNVNGLKNKLKDSDFIAEHIRPNSFNFFIETFLSEEESGLNIDNFKSYHFCRKVKNKNSKRSSGGISAYIPVRFKDIVEIIESKHEDLLWVRFKHQHISTDRDIYLCIVYIKPANSVNQGQQFDTFQVLQEEILAYSRLGHIILGRDFDSRNGNLTDYIEQDTNLYGEGDPDKSFDNIKCTRSSKDKTINNF